MKVAVTIFFLVLTLFAHESKDTVKAQILEKIFTNISIEKDLIIWSDDSNTLYELNERGVLQTTTNCHNATLIVLEDKTKLDTTCSKKAIFVLNYSLLKEIPQSFGAMFWKKGRPNIVILAPRAKEQSIQISKNLNEYLEEKIW